MKRVFVFFDGQAIYKQTHACYNYREANYDPICLSKYITNLEPDRELQGFFFYTGIPQAKYGPRLRTFWLNKIKAIDAGITQEPKAVSHNVFYRDMLYRKEGPRYIGREKGVDVRLAIDAVYYAFNNLYDQAIIFSQDSDLTEAVNMIKEIAKSQKRVITFESAFPYSPKPVHPDKATGYGIQGTTWRTISKSEYDNCIDPLTSTYWPPYKK